MSYQTLGMLLSGNYIIVDVHIGTQINMAIVVLTKIKY